MRYLMVDRILEVEKGSRAVGLKNVSQSEDVFNHHFPEMAVMPGALTLEAMAQTGGRLICLSRDFQVRPMLLAVDKARFKKQILPGDQMRIEVNLMAMGSRMAEVSAVVNVEGSAAAEAMLKFVLTEADETVSAQLRKQFEQLMRSSNNSRRKAGD